MDRNQRRERCRRKIGADHHEVASSNEIARMLPDADANFDLPSNKVYTALMVAAYSGHPLIARLVTDVDANFDIQDDRGSTP
jgi:ankyrin repeat protein